jgi:hypothetical protein
MRPHCAGRGATALPDCGACDDVWKFAWRVGHDASASGELRVDGVDGVGGAALDVRTTRGRR